MAEYRLRLSLTIDPITRPVPPNLNLPGGLANAFSHLFLAEAHAAKGTFVEVETTGDVLEADASMKKAFDPLDYADEKFTLSTTFVVPVTRSGRDLVLLAVGGGNQLFDHWEGWAASRNQGSRCVIPEPPEPDSDLSAEALAIVADYVHEISAIFKTDPDWEPSMGEKLGREKLMPGSSTMHTKLSRPSPRFDREP